MLPFPLLFLIHRTLQCLQLNSRSTTIVPLAPGGGGLSEGQTLQKTCTVKSFLLPDDVGKTEIH